MIRASISRLDQVERIGLFCALLVCLFLRNANAAEVTLNGHTFTIPDGFQIEVVAGPPLVNRPITAEFDEAGRLYVADSSGSNERVDKQLVDKTHRIVRLEDSDGDGRFDKSIVFADKMMFPEGTLWYDGSLYVAAPPSIWKLTDTDGDGVADQRTEWFEGKTLTGCANDLHGPYLGLDGWIYWCKGAFAEQTYPQSSRGQLSSTSGGSETRQLVTKAAHIFRRKADGTGFVENVMTGGMDNPVDVVFMPGGERIFSTTFLQNPGGGLRDGLIHAVYGGVYGKVHDVTNFHPRTGDLMPALVHMGPAAPCGLTRYDSNVFADDFRNNLFACQFNMHKVSRHVLEPDGATFKSTNSDFVVSSNFDFHPTDVVEDADGSLIINDTGGWYMLCCPTSQLMKPDILGAIYRIRRSNSAKVIDPRGLKLEWSHATSADLAARLSDSRPAVRARAIQTLARQGDNAVVELSEIITRSDNPDARRNAVWTLTRLENPKAQTLIGIAVGDRDQSVRSAALHSLSLSGGGDQISSLKKALSDGSPMIRRIAAEAIGRHGNESAVSSLLQAAALSAGDRVLQHSLTFALIEIGKPIDLAMIQKNYQEPVVQRIVAIANDQMKGGHLDPKNVVTWLKSNEPVLKETAVWLVGRHPEWGDTLAGYLAERASERNLTESERSELLQQLSLFSGNQEIQKLISANAIGTSNPTDIVSRTLSLEAMRGSTLKEIPPEWIESLTYVVTENNLALVPLAISTLRTIPCKGIPESLKAGLLTIASSESFPTNVRVEALAAIPEGVAQPQPNHFRLLTDNLREDASVSTRSAAVEFLVKSKLEPSPLEALVDSIPHVGPLELNRLLGAFEQCTDDKIGLKLVDALKASPVLKSLRADTLKQRLAKFSASVHSKAEELYSAINVEASLQNERLNEFASNLADGDIRRGQQVFNSQKAACSACHAMGYVGGTIGPDLSRIGKTRTERDLLEAILFPSVSFVRSYEPILILTKSGKQFNGLIRKETSDEITLVTGAKEEARISRDEIDEIKPSTVSIMPAGLETQLTRQQIADLITFLKAKQ